MKCSIKLITPYGEKYFGIMLDQFILNKDMGLGTEFKNKCKEDSICQDKYLQFFLDDDIISKRYKLDEGDIAGWKYFRTQTDICAVLKYFSERIS